MIKLYDSLTQTLKEINKDHLKIYLCGPTVYDDIHIGNIAPVIIFDFLIRYLKHKKINYTYIHNITDIDDKIINKAKSLSTTEEEISVFYTNKYLEILKDLNIIIPTYLPKVSDHIKDIQEVIKKLEDKGFTKKENKDIVFDITKLKTYGEISKQNLKNLKNSSNFCLWKHILNGKVWKSDWGIGRPGWHSECFTFIEKYAEGYVDIHGGGIDLKFPHHENENAHCRALYNSSLANIWFHIGHLNTIEGKISKSTNQKYLVKDLLNLYSPNLIRFIFLQNKYSLPIIISDEKLNNWNEELNKFILSINKSKSLLFLKNKNIAVENISSEFLEILENDLNTPKLLTWLQQLRKELLTSVKSKNYVSIQYLASKLLTHLKFLGFCIKNIHTEENKKLLKQWQTYMDNKNYIETDKFRKILIDRGLL